MILVGLVEVEDLAFLGDQEVVVEVQSFQEVEGEDLAFQEDQEVVVEVQSFQAVRVEEEEDQTILVAREVAVAIP